MAKKKPEANKALSSDDAQTKEPQAKPEKKPMRKASASSKLSFEKVRTIAINCINNRAIVRVITADGAHQSEDIDVGEDGCVDVTIG